MGESSSIREKFVDGFGEDDGAWVEKPSTNENREHSNRVGNSSLCLVQYFDDCFPNLGQLFWLESPSMETISPSLAVKSLDGRA
jgi:hypothetical protein